MRLLKLTPLQLCLFFFFLKRRCAFGVLNELSQVTEVQSVLFEPESFIPKSIASQEEVVQKNSLDLKAFEYMTSVQQILEVNYMLYI